MRKVHMNASGSGEFVDVLAVLADLRMAGADQCDPVRFCYLEALARRAGQQPDNVKNILNGRLAEALASFKQGVEQKSEPDELTTSPHATPLARLNRYIAERSQSMVDSHSAETIGSRTELKSIRYFRNTWSKLSVDQRVARAIGQAPENAGPLNSHFLVLRSLELMRDISQDYLNRFVSYADTLLCLDQAEKRNKLAVKAVKKPAKAKAVKAPKGVADGN